ncbi:Bug family tripartite tricarboxylate transporter substrate binding protein [Georgenia thermotolerans]|uniref:Tripartite tricarboxylate transporter substrate binding protein n=1 Tax=Georgenia thermotolerans TaxID=527326 RepID=A0A7J5UV24_9MICO|nr:tripartite tricarboxylate transporter substrate binding protein [Georgenia thermotolerans]KAE8766127.1 tripartite tricarboxylate transporter substrate binding protein [Georgenia thermotolerans]
MKRTTRLACLGAVSSLALVLAACSGSASGDDASGDAAASSYPEKDINFIVQAAAGGGSDLSSRALVAELEPILDTSIIVENRPGASGSTAMQYVADQDTDGYTIGFVPVEIAMLGHQNFDVDPADFDFLGQIMLAPGVLSVPADSPYQTLEEFIEGAKTEALSVSNSGAGSIWEAAALGLAAETGAKLTPVPFDGGAPALAAAIGGQVDAAVGGAGETLAAFKEGQVRPLAIFHNERHPDMPDVPTAAEAGYDLEFGGWGGIYAPAGLPDDVRETLESAIEEAAGSDSFTGTITKAGNLPVYRDSAEFTDFVNSEYERFGEILGAQ